MAASQYILRPHKALNMRLVRPFTTDDFVVAVEEIKKSPLFENYEITPEPICEGGFLIKGHQVADGKWDYRCVRFTSNNLWPYIDRTKDVLYEWRVGPKKTIVDFPPDQLVIRRSNKNKGTDCLLVCKASVDVPPWTKEQLLVFVRALIVTGAFTLQGRRRPINHRY